MKLHTYKYILNIKSHIASIISDKIDDRLSASSKDKLVNILGKLENEKYYQLIYDYAVSAPESCEAIVALSRFNREETINYFLKRLSDSRSLHRDLIVECLGKLNVPGIVKILKPYLSDSDRQVRFQTAYALFNTGDKEAALAMCEYIADSDEWISMTILRLLCKMKQIESIPILIEKYNSDNDLRRKALMISFLSRFKSITLLGIFDDALQAKDARLRANAIEAIGSLKLPEDELRKRIVPFLTDPNNRIRANAILAMARIAPDKVKQQISDMVYSDDIQLRRSAAFMLCMVPPGDFLSEAETLIVDKSETVRKRMIRSLTNFSKGFISKNISKVLSDDNKWIRKYAVDMYSSVEGVDATPVINLLKKEQAEANIEACLNFLTLHPTSKALSVLKYHYKDTRIMVVRALLNSLTAIGGVDALKSAITRFDQQDPEIMQSITKAMVAAGDIDTLISCVDRFGKIKTQYNLEMIIPSIEAIVDLLKLDGTMPSSLQQSITYYAKSTYPNPEDAVEMSEADYMPTISKQVIQISVPTDSYDVPEVEIEKEVEAEVQEQQNVKEKTKKKKTLPMHYKAGIKAFNLGKNKRALAEFRKSISSGECPPDSVDLYLGSILCDEGEYKEAIKHLDAYLEHTPDSVKANFLLGKCYKKSKEWKKLVDVYRPFMQGKIELTSENMKKKVQMDMGIACAMIGKAEMAIKLLNAITKIDPMNAEAYYYLSMAFYKGKKIKQSMVTLDRANKLTPAGKALSKNIRVLAEAIKNGLEI